MPDEVLGSRMTPARTMAGATCLRSSSHLPLKLKSNCMKPVALPPGCARLSTKPAPTGSTADVNTRMGARARLSHRRAARDHRYSADRAGVRHLNGTGCRSRPNASDWLCRSRLRGLSQVGIFEIQLADCRGRCSVRELGSGRIHFFMSGHPPRRAEPPRTGFDVGSPAESLGRIARQQAKISCSG